jgi:hypothetical protein
MSTSDRLLVVIVLAACGRIRFAELPTASGDGGTGDGAPDVPGDRANVAFMTSTTTNGAFGGIAQADLACRNAAAGKLPGTFIALLSTTTTLARDRLAGSSGWIRTDGSPFTTTPTEWFTNHVQFAPLDLDESGKSIATTEHAWTATQTDGGNGLFDCSDWTNGTAGMNGVTGDPRSAYGSFTEGALLACNTQQHFYCFEVGHNANVAPTFTGGRIAFLSDGYRATPGIDTLDAICASEAAAAQLPGTYGAAVATSTASIASRFVADSRPWVRPDGTKIADASVLLSTAATLPSFVNQDASGAYLPAYAFFWSGATDPTVAGTATCADWSSVTTGTGITGYQGIAITAQFWNNGTGACSDFGGRVLCLQQ